MTAYTFDAAGNPTATYQGQTIDIGEPGYSLADGSVPTWTFSNLAPNAAGTYDVYLQAGSTIGYTVSNSQGPPNAAASARWPSALGAGWQFLGQVVLVGGSSSLAVSYSGGTPATAVCLLQPMSATVYDSQENVLSQTDAMGNVTAYVNDRLGRPLTTSQGQALAASYNAATYTSSATFANLPQAPNLTRTYTVYAQSSLTLTGSSETPNNPTDSEGNQSFTAGFSAATPLGSGWYQLGTVTLALATRVPG